jgi:hypothetical protein
MNKVNERCNMDARNFGFLDKYKNWSQHNLGKFTLLVSEGPAVCVDISADIIILAKVKELLDLGSPLGSPHPGLLSVSQARQIMLTLLHNNQVNHR